MTSTSCPIRFHTTSALAVVFALAWGMAQAAVSLPPKPARYFNDEAEVVPAAEEDRLNRLLVAVERENGTQLVVAVFRKLPEGAVLEDYTARTAESWGAGGKQADNGVVVFVFVEDRRTRLEVGYGLEDRIPDAIAKRIVQDVMAPHFRQGDYAAGLDAAIQAILRAVRGAEAVPLTPAPPPPRTRGTGIDAGGMIFLIILILLFLRAGRSGRRGGWTATPGGWYHTGGGWWTGGFGGGGHGGFGGGGGGWSGGGGGFSGGGGSFGGGGASGDW